MPYWVPLAAIIGAFSGNALIFVFFVVPCLIWTLIWAIYRISKAFLKFYRPIQAKRDAKWAASRRRKLGYDQ